MTKQMVPMTVAALKKEKNRKARSVWTTRHPPIKSVTAMEAANAILPGRGSADASVTLTLKGNSARRT